MPFFQKDHLRVELEADGVAVLWLDVPGRPVNVFTAAADSLSGWLLVGKARLPDELVSRTARAEGTDINAVLDDALGQLK